jgi:raffinose/stachyose/melibiose transport system permease protein
MILEKLKYVAVHTVKWAYLLFFLAVALLPLLWLFLSSFKTEAEFITQPLALPSVWQFQNYVNAVTVANMHVLFMNSIIVASVATLLNLLVTSMGAFVMSRERFHFRDGISNLIVSGVVMPIVAFMVPYLAIIRTLGLYDTRMALILTYAAINLPISFFLIKSFMVGIPKDLEDAAIIDGCSFAQRYTKVVLPLSRSGLVTAGTLCFIWSWNEFIYALLLTSSSSVRTVQLGISFFSTQFRTDYPSMYAAVVLTMIPSIIVYVFFHDKIISGLTAGAVKG